MRDRWTTPLLTVACLILILAACGTEDSNEPASGPDSSTATAAKASPTSAPAATPIATFKPTPPPPASPAASPSTTPPVAISIADLATLDWQLAEINGAPVLDGSIVTVSLAQRDDNYITGHADCHDYMTVVTWDDASFQIDPNSSIAGPHTDELPCQTSTGGAEQHAAFFTALAEVTSYQATDERLTLLDSAGQPRLVFVPRPVVTVDPALTGSNWLLVGMRGASPLPGTTITLTFNSDGVVGRDGCNELSGALLAAGDGRLTVVDAGGTDMGCETPEGIMAQAERFAEALFHASSYRVDGDQLQIMDSSGAAILTFMREGAAFDAALAAHGWALVEIDGQPALPEPLVTLELAEGSISGNDGCNTFGGQLTLLGGGAIEVSDLTQTLIGCDAPILEQAHVVTSSLSAATHYRLAGERLSIGDEGGIRLVFAPLDGLLLTSASWTLVSFSTHGSNGWSGPIQGTEITLTLDPGGMVSGNAGCNGYGGFVTVDRDTIAFSQIAWELKACSDPPGIAEQEQDFLAALQAATTWRIAMNDLILTTDDGQELVFRSTP